MIDQSLLASTAINGIISSFAMSVGANDKQTGDSSAYTIIKAAKMKYYCKTCISCILPNLCGLLQRTTIKRRV
jgi:hypothetical protein